MPHNFGDNLVTRNAHAHALTNSASYIKRYKNEMRLQKLRLRQPSIGQVVTVGRRVKRGIKNVRPMKAPTFENAYLDRTRRTRKKKSCRQKTLLIIRQYDTRLQTQHILRQRAWRQRRVAQNKKQKVPTATNERRVAAVADRFLLREFNEDPIDPWNTSSVTNMYDWEAVVFNQPISQWQIKLATSCK